MKSVWIIWDDGDYDTGPNVAAIYETSELGNKILEELKERDEGYYYYLEEWELDTKAP